MSGEERKPLREERKEKIMRSKSALKENQTSPWDNFHEGRKEKEKIGWIGDAIQRDGDHVSPSRFGIKPCLGSTKVVLDFEYIDSVHHNQRGAITGGVM